MKRYEVISVKVTLASGVLQLSKEQAGCREHALRPMGDGLFLIDQPVEFKCGEVIGYDGEINKILMTEIEPLDGDGKKADKAGKKADKAKK